MRLTPAARRPVNREKLIEELRLQLAREIPEALVQVCDVTNAERFPLGADIELALMDLSDHGLEELRRHGEILVERLTGRPELTGVHLSAGARFSPQLGVVVNAAQAKALGVAPKDIVDTLQAVAGQVQASDFNRFGRSWQILIPSDRLVRPGGEELKRLKVRNSAGNMVPLGTIATFQAWTGPVLVERYNLRRMVGLIAHPAPGVSLTEARKVCETVFAEVSQGSPEPKAFALESMRPALPRHSLP